jgi:hypothetical protein
MNVTEETIDAVLDSNGELRLTHQPSLPPGPVRVTIRVAAEFAPKRGLADVTREIAAEQRSRGFLGRSADELRAEDDALQADDDERDRELDAARRRSALGGP